MNRTGSISCVCCAIIQEKELGSMETFGKYTETLTPGCHWLNPFVGQCFVGALSTAVASLVVRCDTKTRDNVFISAEVSVQYEIISDKFYDAFYRLSNPEQQMNAYVYDVLRSSVPKLDLDDVFTAKAEIADQVKQSLSDKMIEFGVNIRNTLVTDLQPDPGVKRSMNEINAATRNRVAAVDRAEANKIMVVKRAEADSERTYLQGVGVAKQRDAIVDGLRESTQSFADSVEGITVTDVMELILATNYFDMLEEVGASSKTNAIFIPGGVSVNGALLGNQVMPGPNQPLNAAIENH